MSSTNKNNKSFLNKKNTRDGGLHAIIGESGKRKILTLAMYRYFNLTCVRQTAENVQDCDYVTKCPIQRSCLSKPVFCATRLEDGLEAHKFVKVFGPLADPSVRVVLRRMSATVLWLISQVRIQPRA
jgi:hypothetical protein